MVRHSSDEETPRRSTRRGRQPVGGRLRRRRGDDADSSDDDVEEVDLDRLKKPISSKTSDLAARSKDDEDTVMVDGKDDGKDNDDDDNDNIDKSSNGNNDERALRALQQLAPSLNQTLSQTQTQNLSQESSQVPQGLAIGDADLNTLRIMLSTDNHLGYAEDDNIRGNDSFAALEEVLFLAKEYRCDMVLLAGDLFHHNRPSRRTLYKTMEIFKRYCMGPGSIQVQIVGGSAEDAAAAATGGGNKKDNPFVRGYANYEDENYSIDLPVFSIHGNHDDPSRDGGNSELYAALDLLDVNNLVNYFGKQEDTKNIRIDPILLQKGTTRVALYGLGNMRDERLNRMWRGEHLSFSRPVEDDNPSCDNNEDGEHSSREWFNILALHQNRDRGRGAKNCVKEDMIPDWMDFICWGHEHECDIEVNESVVGTFRISQPGSSVATSLVEGESMRKKIGLLDIREGQFRLTTIPLTQVRSFVLDTVRLADVPNLDPDSPKVDVKLSKILEDKVRVLIHDAREKRRELLCDAEDGGNTLAKYYNNNNLTEIPLKQLLDKEDEVLVRLKVDHTGFAAVNNQRFGAKFVGDCANPTDILLFTRKRAENKSQSKSMKDIKPIEPSELEEIAIEELIIRQFEESNTKLELFDDKKISLALDCYVEKDEKNIINETLNKLLERSVSKLIKSGAKTATEGLQGSNEVEDSDETDKGKKKKGKSKRKNSEDDNEDAEVSDEDPRPTSSSRSRTTKKETNGSRKKGASRSHQKNTSDYDSDDDDNDDEVVVTSKSKVRSTSDRGRKTAPKRTKYSEDDDSDIQVVDPAPRKRAAKSRTTERVDYSIDDDSDDDIVVVESDNSDDSPPPKKKGKAVPTKKAAKKSSVTAKKRSRDSTGSSSSRGLSQSQLSFTSTKRKPSRGELKRKTTGRKSRYNNNVDSDDDNSDFQPARPSYEDDDEDAAWGTASNTASTF